MYLYLDSLVLYLKPSWLYNSYVLLDRVQFLLC